METDEISTELDAFRTQIAYLESTIPHLHSTLLSLPSVATDLQRASNTIPSIDIAREAVFEQQTHNTSINYRLLAGVTAFKVHDPDPQAAYEGDILGLRIELPQGPRFLTPYFVFLLVKHFPGTLDNEPDTTVLKLHVHTLPAAIPVSVLAKKYLPPQSKAGKPQKTQDLHLFVRTLRHTIVSYHTRLMVIEDLRVEAGIAEEIAAEGQKRRIGKAGITSITGSDAAHEVEITFRDGIIAKLRMSKGGHIESVATGVEAGKKSEDLARRRAALDRMIKGGDGRIEGVVQRLMGGELG